MYKKEDQWCKARENRSNAKRKSNTMLPGWDYAAGTAELQGTNAGSAGQKPVHAKHSKDPKQGEISQNRPRVGGT